MLILIWGILIFFIFFTIHIARWRIYPPKQPTNSLFRLFLLNLILSLILLWIASRSTLVINLFFPKNLLECLHISLLYLSLGLFYIFNYPAIEADSPSLLIIQHIADAGSHGLAKEELYKMMTDDMLIKTRIMDLMKDGLVYKSGDIYRLTKKGNYTERVFIFYRRILNMPKGG